VRILFSTFGSLGDLHPYLAIATRAKARGHTPVIATSPKYRAKVEAEGVEFRAVRPDMPSPAEFGPLAERVMDSKRGPEFLFKEILVPNLYANYRDLLEAGADADCIVTHPAALGGPLAAQKLGKLWLSSVLSPISLWSRYDPPSPPTIGGSDWLRVFGPAWGLISQHLAEHFTKDWFGAWHQLRESEGIPERGHPIFGASYSPHGTLALFSPLFGKPQRDWPTNTVATGFCYFDKSGYQEQHSGDWRGWMEVHPRPVVFTLGSSAVYDAGPFWERSREYLTAGGSGRGAVFMTGGTQVRPKTESELALDYAPFSELFPLAGLVVHQGGIGTTAQVLRAGVPQLVVPYAHDQPDNGRRIRKLGVGLTATREAYNAGKASAIVARLLNDRRQSAWQHRAAALAERLRSEDGPAAACQAIESCFALSR